MEGAKENDKRALQNIKFYNRPKIYLIDFLTLDLEPQKLSKIPKQIVEMYETE